MFFYPTYNNFCVDKNFENAAIFTNLSYNPSKCASQWMNIQTIETTIHELFPSILESFALSGFFL